MSRMSHEDDEAAIGVRGQYARGADLVRRCNDRATITVYCFLACSLSQTGALAPITLWRCTTLIYRRE
ncbi:hypothetical protein [Ktedonospora formicarum]|uniref:hypothetical protein n=1 Tax=Ktedonospora formicarum TaxID=2778364 RepID=UPI001C687E13|nr:hypothetical protein [Ktedonospora formicarum]